MGWGGVSLSPGELHMKRWPHLVFSEKNLALVVLTASSPHSRHFLLFQPLLKTCHVPASEISWQETHSPCHQKLGASFSRPQYASSLICLLSSSTHNGSLLEHLNMHTHRYTHAQTQKMHACADIHASSHAGTHTSSDSELGSGLPGPGYP